MNQRVKITELPQIGIPEERALNDIGIRYVSDLIDSRGGFALFGPLLKVSLLEFTSILSHAILIHNIKGLSSSNIAALNMLECDVIGVLAERNAQEIYDATAGLNLRKRPSVPAIQGWIDQAKVYCDGVAV